MAVCPLEHELYYSEDLQNPIEKRNEGQQNALSAFPKMTIINSNLVFGQGSYLIHYMAQCAKAGKIPFHLGNPKNTFNYSPVHSDDLALAVQTAFKQSGELKG